LRASQRLAVRSAASGDTLGSGRWRMERPVGSTRWRSPPTPRAQTGQLPTVEGSKRPPVSRHSSVGWQRRGMPSGVSAEGLPRGAVIVGKLRHPIFVRAAKRRDRQRCDFGPLLRTRPSGLCFVGLKFFVRCARERLATFGRCSSTDRVSLSAPAGLLSPGGAHAFDRWRITCGG
jgi:hypothetical protein